VQRGSCYCLLGRNGVGKSTLINIMADLIEPDQGCFRYDRWTYNNNPLEIKKNIGVMSEHLPLINELTGMQYFTLQGMLYDIAPVQLHDRMTSVVSYFFDDTAILDKTIGTLSMGTKKRLALCSILLHAPKVLILDEPFNSWDPVSLFQLIEFLNVFIKSGNTIFVASHDLLYIDQIATHIGVLDHASLVFSSTLEDFKSSGTKNIEESLLCMLHVENKKQSELSWIFEH
jgi:ABC-2 type transport system ATP-binding protein